MTHIHKYNNIILRHARVIALVSVLSRLVVIVVVIGFMMRRHARMEPSAREPEADEEPRLDSLRSALAELGNRYQWYAKGGRARQRKAYLTKKDVESCF